MKSSQKPSLVNGEVILEADVVEEVDVYFSKIMSAISDHLLKEKLCDVHIIVGNKKIPAHRLMLSAGCEYFRNTFINSENEACSSEIILQDVDEDAMVLLIQYIYTGILEIDTENVEPIVLAALKLGMDDVKEIGCRFLASRLAVSNCLRAKQFASDVLCQQLRDAAHMFIMDNFEEVCRLKEFKKLSLNQVAELLKSDYVNVLEESVMLGAAVEWLLENKLDSSAFSYQHLIKQVRFASFDKTFLSGTVLECPTVIKSKYCMELIKDILGPTPKAEACKKWGLLPKRKPVLRNREVAQLWLDVHYMFPASAVASIERLWRGINAVTSPEQRCKMLLDFLDSLVENVRASDEVERDEVLQSVAKLFQLLNNDFQVMSKELKGRMMHCLCCWVETDLPPTACQRFLLAILGCVKIPDLLSSSIACLTRVVRSVCLISCFEDDHRFLIEVFALPKTLKNVSKGDALLVYEFFHDLTLYQTKQVVLVLLELSAKGVNVNGLIEFIHSSYRVTLQHDFVTKSDESDNTATKCSEKWFCENFVLLFQRAYMHFTTLAALEKGLEKVPQQRIDYCNRMSSSFADLVEVFGRNRVFESVNRKFKNYLESGDGKFIADRCELESSLFGINAVLATTEVEPETLQLAGVAAALSEVDEASNRQLSETVLNSVRLLTPWLKAHPEYLGTLLSVALDYVNEPRLSEMAAETILHVVRGCGQITSDCFRAATKKMSAPSAQNDLLLDKSNTTMTQSLCYVKSIGYLLSGLPNKQITKEVTPLVKVLSESFFEVRGKEFTPGNRSRIAKISKLFAALVSSIAKEKRVLKTDVMGLVYSADRNNLWFLLRVVPGYESVLNKWMFGLKSATEADDWC